MMNRKLIRKLLLYIVDHLRDMEAEVSTIRLVKLLYLIDLEYFNHHDTILTGIDWIYYHYGPYFIELDSILRSASIDLDAREIMTRSGRGFTYKNLEEQTISKDVDFPTEQQINRLLQRWGPEDTPTILKYVYGTPPIKYGKRGDHINFSLVSIKEQAKPDAGMLDTTAYRLMLVSEGSLAKDWNTPEEDQAWAYLSKER